LNLQFVFQQGVIYLVGTRKLRRVDRSQRFQVLPVELPCPFPSRRADVVQLTIEAMVTQSRRCDGRQRGEFVHVGSRQSLELLVCRIGSGQEGRQQKQRQDDGTNSKRHTRSFRK
jgi:hypothetical protein